MHENQVTELEEQVHILSAHCKDAAALLSEIDELKKAREELAGKLTDAEKEILELKEENVNYLEAIQNCVKECEQCVRELQEVREREASHQTLLSEIRVNFTALLQAYLTQSQYQHSLEQACRSLESLLRDIHTKLSPSDYPDLLQCLTNTLTLMNSFIQSLALVPSSDLDALFPASIMSDETDASNGEKEMLAEELRRVCCERVALERACLESSEGEGEGEKYGEPEEIHKEEYEVWVEGENDG